MNDSNSFLTSPITEENSGLLTGNPVDLTNQRDLSQSSESNSKHSKHIEVYSRRFKKAGQKGKKRHHKFSNPKYIKVYSRKFKKAGQKGKKRLGKYVFFSECFLAVDGKQKGYVKEKTQAAPASKVSTGTDSNIHKVETINSETNEKTKCGGKKKNKKKKTTINGNLISVSEKEVNGSVKSESIYFGEKINLYPEILSKSEMRENNISQTRTTEEENNGLRGTATIDAASKSDPPHLPESNPKNSGLKYTRRKYKKNETPICSSLISISEKEFSGSMKSEIIDPVDKIDLYPEICSNSEMRNAKPNLEKAHARKRDRTKMKTPIVSEDYSLDNAQLCNVSPKLLEQKNEDLYQLQKNEMSIEEKFGLKDKRSSSLSVENVADVTLDATITGNGTLDDLPISLQRVSISYSKKKLLVLDLNGLLVDVTNEYHSSQRAPIKVAGKSVFKRPFCDEFLDFCFERFDVGIWSSRTRKNMDAVVNFLFRDKRSQPLFCWSQSKCTSTGFNTMENVHKPLVLKEMKKLWNNEDQDLPWEKGDYSPSNTLLIDDSPYKAICNPPHTAIFPSPYSYRDQSDNSLGLGGDLRVYLERLAWADNVQSYVKEHPFGQHAITPGNPSWKFYLQIIEKINPYFNQLAVADGV